MRHLLINFPLGHMANDWAPGAIWILGPAIAASMGLSPTELGLLLSIHYMGAAVGYLPAGILADRVSNQGRLLVMTFWWVAIGYFLASFMEDFWVLAIMLAIAGMGDAAWHPIATGVLVEQMPKRRGMVLGIHAMGGTFAEVGAPLIVGFLLAVFDWRTTLQLSVIPAVIMGTVFIFLSARIPRSNLSAVSAAELRQMSKHWLKARGITLMLKIAIYNMALLALMSMTPLFLQQDLGYNPAVAGIIFATAMLIGCVLQPLIGRYSDMFDRNRIFIFGSVIAIGFSVTAALASSTHLVVTVLVLNMAVLVSIRSGVLASAVEYAGRRASTTLGLVFMVLDGVGALGAVFAGWVAESGMQNVFALAGVLSLISIGLALLHVYLGRFAVMEETT